MSLRGFSKDAKSAIKAIMKVVGADQFDESFLKSFKTPAEWEARGEQYGNGSVLIVIHDGPPLHTFFDLNYGDVMGYDALQTELGKLGLYANKCTGWYSAIYRD
jgi:hypothetical protein